MTLRQLLKGQQREIVFLLSLTLEELDLGSKLSFEKNVLFLIILGQNKHVEILIFYPR